VGQPQPPPGVSAKERHYAALEQLSRLGKPELVDQMGRVHKQVELARAKNQGQASGQTMVILASALAKVSAHGDKRARRWKWVVGGVMLLSALGALAMGDIIWRQHRRISRLVSEKVAIDKQIQSVFTQMATETDEAKLGQLETRLEALMGSAKEKAQQAGPEGSAQAALQQPVDELDAQLKRVLHSFHAETYAVPPIFKQAIRQQMDAITSNPSLPSMFARKAKYWPAIQSALAERQLPEELGYIAFTESYFNPMAFNATSRASGMWQLMEETGRECGLAIHHHVDERFDPVRSSQAASIYLSKLMIEFGEESFMLSLASYNRGENGVRRALHELAREPGGWRKRDFWHLYRRKFLPEETRDYVPKVLAAAIVFGNPDKYGPHVISEPRASAP
jgi:hypothetical protein